MKRYWLLILALWSVLFSTQAQQEPIYSQYMFNPTIINPGYCGVYDMFSATAFYRRQYYGLETGGEPTTYSFNAHTSLPIDKMGAGVTMTRDQIGINTTHKFELIYSYKLDLGNSKLSVGVNTGINHFVTDPNGKINATDESDEFYIASRTAAVKPSFGIGIMYLADKYFVGLSAPSMFDRTIKEGTNSFKTVNRHIFLTAGYVIDLNTHVKIKPSVLLRHVSGSPLSYDLNGSILLHQDIWAGISFRNPFMNGKLVQSIILMGQIQISDAFKAGVSFDLAGQQKAIREAAAFEIGDITGLSAFELMANFNLGLFGSQAVQTTVY